MSKSKPQIKDNLIDNYQSKDNLVDYIFQD